jgi:nitroreductase
MKSPFLKETPLDHPVHDLIKDRWSPRMFSDKAISATELKSLFEAGRWAPSSSNLQPWNIVWGIKGSTAYDRIQEVLVPFNQSWVINAPVLLLGVINKKTADGKENFHALHDLGQFMANLAIQAHSMGIAVHQMAGLDFEKAKAEFKFPDDYHVATAIAVGYYGGETSDLPEGLEKQEVAPRKRKSQIEFTFNGDFIQHATVEK